MADSMVNVLTCLSMVKSRMANIVFALWELMLL